MLGWCLGLLVPSLDRLGIAEMEASVVKALSQKNNVRESVVNGQDDLRNTVSVK